MNVGELKHLISLLDDRTEVKIALEGTIVETDTLQNHLEFNEGQCAVLYILEE